MTGAELRRIGGLFLCPRKGRAAILSALVCLAARGGGAGGLDATRLQHAGEFASSINVRGQPYGPRRFGRGVAQPG